MSERERLTPSPVTSTKPTDDSERDYRDCVERMDETERRLLESAGGRRFLERVGRIGR